MVVGAINIIVLNTMIVNVLKSVGNWFSTTSINLEKFLFQTWDFKKISVTKKCWWKDFLNIKKTWQNLMVMWWKTKKKWFLY